MTLSEFRHKRKNIKETYLAPEGLNPFERRAFYKPIINDLEKQLSKEYLEIVRKQDKVWNDKVRSSVV